MTQRDSKDGLVLLVPMEKDGGPEVLAPRMDPGPPHAGSNLSEARWG